MKASHISGLLLAAAVLWFGVFESFEKSTLYLDSRAMLLVFGGTFSVILIALSPTRIWSLVRLFVLGFVLKRGTSNLDIIKALLRAGVEIRNSGKLQIMFLPAQHPFLIESLQLVTQSVLAEEDLRDALRIRSQNFKLNYSIDANDLAAIAKFPPAFGLLGVIAGIISVVSLLEKNGGDFAGPAIATALVAGFWGITLSNLFILPLADYASQLALDDTKTRQIIVEGALMIKRGDTVQVMSEKLVGFLSVKERTNRVFVKWLQENAELSARDVNGTRKSLPKPQSTK